MTEHDSFGLACSPWGVDERAALVGLLAGDDGIEGFIRLLAPELQELIPLENVDTNHLDDASRTEEILFLMHIVNAYRVQIWSLLFQRVFVLDDGFQVWQLVFDLWTKK